MFSVSIKMPGIYIHIPYCIKKCAYCDFVSVPTENGVPEAYFHALLNEIERQAETFQGVQFNTVFVGGGTPSLLSSKQMEALVKSLKHYYNIQSEAEFSVECNPGTVDYLKLSGYRSIGINRLSIGLQSSNNTILKEIGRIHDYSDFARTMDSVHRAGYTNFNVDIMYGLPGETEDDLIHTVNAVYDSGATHLSAYSLILEENTPLHKRVTGGLVLLPSDDRVADVEEKIRQYIVTLGYERYEISNYAKNGYRCLHNINYWENGPYVGFGVAAHSAFRLNGEWKRWNNTSDISEYVSLMKNGNDPIKSCECIEKKEEMFETVMLGLRMTDGFEWNSFKDRFGIAIESIYGKAIDRLIEYGWLNEELLKKGRLALSDKGLDLQNRALLLFMD